jgi:hypothetical protein
VGAPIPGRRWRSPAAIAENLPGSTNQYSPSVRVRDPSQCFHWSQYEPSVSLMFCLYNAWNANRSPSTPVSATRKLTRKPSRQTGFWEMMTKVPDRLSATRKRSDARLLRLVKSASRHEIKD